MENFEINENVIEESSMDIIHEQMQETIERINIEREKLLAMALHKGYDGVDVHVKSSMVTDHRDYSMGFEYEAWKGEPPTLERWSSNVRRYDFRLLDEAEKRQLLARIGVDYYDDG